MKPSQRLIILEKKSSTERAYPTVGYVSFQEGKYGRLCTKVWIETQQRVFFKSRLSENGILSLKVL